MFFLEKQDKDGKWVLATTKQYTTAFAAAGDRGALQARLGVAVKITEVKPKQKIPLAVMVGALAAKLWLAGVDLAKIDRVVAKRSITNRIFTPKKAA
jgi:hypothetical protein